MKVGKTAWMALLAALLLTLFVPSAFAGPVDSDGDGVPDASDNCVNEANAGQANSDNDTWGDECDNCSQADNQDQCDFNNDGYGNACDPDNTDDNVVGVPDFGGFKSDFGMTGLGNCANANDYNNDGTVGVPDFGVFKSGFIAGVPGPSGVDCADGANAGACPPESP